MDPNLLDLRTTLKTAAQRTVGAERASYAAAYARDARASAAYVASPVGRRSARELRAMRNTYHGERCFILGNGPSLVRLDLSRLRDEYTFGLNRGYLLFERLGFETTFLVCVNTLVAEQFGQELQGLRCRRFISMRAQQYVGATAGVNYLLPLTRPQFSADVSRGIWEGSTVTYVAMQLAFHLGFTQVVLIGVDHKFHTTGPAHQTVTASTTDANHFDPDYFGPGVRWQLPNLTISENAYRMAREHFAAAGREIVDATLDGELTVFPKADYAELV